MTHDFIHTCTSLYCRFYPILTENIIKGGGSPLSFSRYLTLHVNFASFSTRHYNGVLWKTHFLGLRSCIKTFILKKTGHNFLFKN